MTTENPCPGFLTSLRNVCKNVDTKLSDLELSTESAGLSGRYKGCEGSEALLLEARDLKEEMKRSLGTVKEEREKLNCFLGQMKNNFEELVLESMKLEEFMAQYGYKPSQPYKPEDWDWDKLVNEDIVDTTPAAAAEFDNQKELVEGDDAAISKSVGNEATTVGSAVKRESLSIYDIGLSKESLMLVTGLKVQQVPMPEPSGDQVNAPHKSNGDQVNAPPKSPPVVVRVDKHSLINDESAYAGSPCLRLQSKLPQVSYSNLSLPAVDSSCLEITPGLPNRRPRAVVNKLAPRAAETTLVPSPSPLDSSNLTTDTIPSQLYKTGDVTTPDTPNLATDDVKKPTHETEEVTMAAPILPSRRLTENIITQAKQKDADVPTSSPMLPARKIIVPSISGTPEMPVLESVDINALLQEIKVQEPKSLQEIKLQEPKGDQRSRQITPEFPKLETMNAQDFLRTENKAPQSNQITPEEPLLTSTNSRPASKSPETPVLHFKY